jgi:hypothetical protein
MEYIIITVIFCMASVTVFGFWQLSQEIKERKEDYDRLRLRHLDTLKQLEDARKNDYRDPKTGKFKKAPGKK